MDEMSNKEFVTFLRTLADLIEAKAKTPEEAAEIIRQKASESDQNGDK